LVEASTTEGKTEPGEVLREEVVLLSSTDSGKELQTEQGEVLREEVVLLSSTDSGKELQNPEESESDASWTTHVVSEPWLLQLLHLLLCLKWFPDVMSLEPGVGWLALSHKTTVTTTTTIITTTTTTPSEF